MTEPTIHLHQVTTHTFAGIDLPSFVSRGEFTITPAEGQPATVVISRCDGDLARLYFDVAEAQNRMTPVYQDVTGFAPAIVAYVGMDPSANTYELSWAQNEAALDTAESLHYADPVTLIRVLFFAWLD
jgi:hypothetical protein